MSSVALRRLRSLISGCNEILSKQERATARVELKRVFTRLGNARDFDIALAALNRGKAGKYPQTALSDIQQRQQAAYRGTSLAKVATFLSAHARLDCPYRVRSMDED